MRLRSAAALGVRDLGDARGEPLDLLQLHAVPGRVADHCVEAAGWLAVFPIVQYARKRGFPMQKTAFGGEERALATKRAAACSAARRFDALAASGRNCVAAPGRANSTRAGGD